MDDVQDVGLRRVEDADIEVIFEHQADPVAVQIAAFPSRDREQHEAHWARIRSNDAVVTRTITVDGEVAGYIGSWAEEGEQFLGYWIGQEWWGRGVATRALALMVAEVPVRPLHAHVVAHNVGSIRVLEKCGFRRQQEQEEAPSDDGIVELHFVLDD
ncbi:RimJ/RimL family protein N-acetyltransferase [Nocardioides sp. BE266]|uniref:GNAT family N-acetyltransferase n=1 Tax=Nocardioides sp. BE266 TaxID=2817725 RepID=UPI00285E7516|nr:GNAT family N-acetyltransferase [Nocardioides sp. BE266]MDR7252428.1 RimJ/RimL family protein N-acetyltransferase [Nocardioides sp. BE266]